MRLAAELPAASALATLRGQTGLSSIVVHTAVLDPATAAAWESAAAPDVRDDLHLAARVDQDLVFDVVAPR